MFQHIWRKLVELWRRIKQLFIKTPPPSPRQTPPPSFEECEQKFMQLLDGVAEGWNRAKIQAFLVKANITIYDWENWLQEFRQRILESPQLNTELARRLVLLGEVNYGKKITDLAGKIGQELLERQNQTGKPLGNSSPTLTNPPKVEEMEINPQAIELFNQGRECYFAGDLEGAISLWKKTVEIDPKNVNAWYNLGICYGNLGRYKEAISERPSLC